MAEAMVENEIVIRRMGPSDEPAVLALIEAALGRQPDPRNAGFFAWKHAENAYGPSPSWVALDGERVVGLRTLMRWEFETPTGSARAVRAVDTATHPECQGRGIFSALTRQALAELREEGIDFVFNTPNDKSRPGYLKLGWQEVGKLPAGLLPSGLTSLPRIAAARTAAGMWSTPVEAGLPVPEALADDDEVWTLLKSLPAGSGIRTRRTPEYLRWRYGFEPLAYRALLAGTSPGDGLLLVRVRPRGRATELVVADVLLPEATPRAVRRLIRTALRATGADYALGLRTTPSNGLLPLPGQGPILTWREVTSDAMPALPEWKLSLGDIELF
ncbi:MAG TPA: GNAT family N-acetyltransferase [Jiangellaceae bacterium]